jgi:hypothetical protein
MVNGIWYNRFTDLTDVGHASLKIDATGSGHITYYHDDVELYKLGLKYAEHPGGGNLCAGSAHECHFIHGRCRTSRAGIELMSARLLIG